MFVIIYYAKRQRQYTQNTSTHVLPKQIVLINISVKSIKLSSSFVDTWCV